MKYIGKDIIHYGCGLDLNPAMVWRKIAYSARKNIRKAGEASFIIEKKKGTPDELKELRELWYFPNDPNFPTELSDKDFLYLAYLDGKLAGGIILIPVGTHLFLNNLIASHAAQKYQLQGYLLWHVVNDLKDSSFRYIDIGVSYRPNLYKFFKKWATFYYPVIFNPPSIKPLIRFTPFMHIINTENLEVDEARIYHFCLERPYTILPDINFAEWILRDRGIGYDKVSIPIRDLKKVQVVDLTLLLPVQYGAIVIGYKITPEELWNQYGCYDHFKADYLRKVLSNREFDLEKICKARENVYQCYLQYFKEEDVKIIKWDDFFDSFIISLETADRLAKRYRDFGIEIIHKDSEIHFPCHQNISHKDIEYIYAIYRGYLNLCSEWVPTHVRGVLK